MTIEIHGFAPSTYTQTALLTAAELGLEAQLSPLAFRQASHLARHPYAKMPAMSHGEVALFETLAIAIYLNRALGDGRLEPAQPVEAARMFQWISVAVDYAYEDLVNGLHADAPSDAARKAAGEQLDLLESGLGSRRWFAGDGLTLADLFLDPMLQFCAGKLGEGALSRRPGLARWYATLSARSGARRIDPA
jgi:glutathione S-transferase